MAMQIRLATLAMASVMALLSGCDDPEKAQDKCASLVSTYCDRVVSCAQQGNLLNGKFGPNDLRSECEKFMNDDARCHDAVRVGKSFNQCVDESSQVSCADLVDTLSNADSQNDRYLGAIPASCQDSVKYVDD